MKGKYLTLIGTALILVLTSKTAVGQASKFRVQQINDASGGPAVTPSTGQPISQGSSTSTSTSTPPKLRPDVLKILCTDFPQNSQCQTSSAAPDAQSGTTSDPGKKPKKRKHKKDDPSGTSTPGTAPSDTGTPGSGRGAPPDSVNPLSAPSNGTTPDKPGKTTSPDSSGTTPLPGSGGSGSQQNITPGTPSDTGTPGSGTGTPPDSSTPSGGTSSPGDSGTSGGSGTQKVTPSGGSQLNPPDSGTPGSSGSQLNSPAGSGTPSGSQP